MLTLREFVERVNFNQHYRVYAPNRDCLVYESYFKIHSPYFFDEEHEKRQEYCNKDYWDNNDYCNSVLTSKGLDEETKTFLDRFGDYEIFGIECSGFKPKKMYLNDKGKLIIEYVNEKSMSDREYIDCINLFIVAKSTGVYYEEK